MNKKELQEKVNFLETQLIAVIKNSTAINCDFGRDIQEKSDALMEKDALIIEKNQIIFDLQEKLFELQEKIKEILP